MSDFEIIVSLIKNILPSGTVETKLTMDSKLKDDLGMDSMNLAEFLMNLENEFNYDLSDVLRHLNIVTISDAVEAVGKRKVIQDE